MRAASSRARQAVSVVTTCPQSTGWPTTGPARGTSTVRSGPSSPMSSPAITLLPRGSPTLTAARTQAAGMAMPSTEAV
jgi:hypothetical protein